MRKSPWLRPQKRRRVSLCSLGGSKKNGRENKEFLALGTLRLEEYKHVTFLPSLPPFGFFNYGAGLQALTYLII